MSVAVTVHPVSSGSIVVPLGEASVLVEIERMSIARIAQEPQ